jgi:hypothetical protein
MITFETVEKIRNTEYKDPVVEYRKKHPRCRYCKYYQSSSDYCIVKRKEIFPFDIRAKFCKLYDADHNVK